MEKKMDYDRYHFTGKDWIEFVLKISVKAAVISYLFYDSYKAFVLLFPLAWFDFKSLRAEKTEMRKQQLTKQFKEMMESLRTSLNAGYSLEHSLMNAKRDLSLLLEPEAVIFAELDGMIEGLKINIPLEELLKDFGSRSGVEDINNFANVVMAAKKSGGNLIRIIEKTVHSISDKLAVEGEIRTMVAAKRLEERIMMVMPYGIIFYLRVTNGEFLEILYHNAAGVIWMTLFLAVIYIADLWAQRIMEIRV
ncbi:MAG: type II secretion system F family protein [Clostridium sp.]|nr:type II secretion system F family protein [Clostridium sp.]